MLSTTLLIDYRKTKKTSLNTESKYFTNLAENSLTEIISRTRLKLNEGHNGTQLST